MTKTVYALLVGINKYPAPIPELNGCVNDVRRMSEFLSERLAGEAEKIRLELEVLTDEKATREAVIRTFRTHLSKAADDDVALFYYSGHGSQELAPPAFWHLEPDHLNETLVCVDSRTSGGYDLADKELAQLLHEVATQYPDGTVKSAGPHVLAILDACHSGSGTRDADGTRVRLAPLDTRSRPLSSYIVTAETARQLTADDPNQGVADWFQLPRGRHVSLSACRAEESAKERAIGEDSETRGVFSYYLLDTLQRRSQSLSYRDLHSRIVGLVKNVVGGQEPQLEAVNQDDLNRGFLNDSIPEQTLYYYVSYDQHAQNWFMDGGAVHGIPAAHQASEDETTVLSIFPLDKVLERDSDLEGKLGTAKVKQVLPGKSVIELAFEGGHAPDTRQHYRAVIAAIAKPPVPVHLKGDSVSMDPLRDLIEKNRTGPGGQFRLSLADNNSDARFEVIADGSGYILRRASDPKSLIVRAATHKDAYNSLCRMANWLELAERENRASRLAADAITLEIYPVNAEGVTADRPIEGAEVRLQYEMKNGELVSPMWRARITNTTNRQMYCMFLDLAEDYAIDNLLPDDSGSILLRPKGETGDSTWVQKADGSPFDAWIPEDLVERGVTELHDILKVIASTDKASAATLTQKALEVTTRGIGSDPRKAGAQSDWIARHVTFITALPLNAARVPEAGENAASVPGGDLRVEAHAGALNASIRLMPLDAANRDANQPVTPSVLRQDPRQIQPVDFSASRDATMINNALELTFEAAGDSEKITVEAPLVLHSDQRLGQDESVLVISYDPESRQYLPVGYGYPKNGTTEIRIEQLPKPSGAGDRDMKGTVVMLAYKLLPGTVATALGIENPYPKLRIAWVDDNGEARYEERGAVFVRDAVAGANRILLYIHGLTGDTRGMVCCTRELYRMAPDLPKYDLVLAFDYENVNTRIQDTAVKLRERLEAVGLGAGHGKTLHIVAHSLGTQVSRWFIERERGNRIVSKLVMMGPPNNGSPLAVLQEWATYLIGLALNGLLTLINPASALVYLVRFASTAAAGFEKIDTTIDQLKVNSEFYKDLNGSGDPMVAYYVVVGDTKQIEVSATGAEDQDNALARVARRVFSPRTGHRILSLAFANRPNDMALSVASAGIVATLTPARNPIPAIAVVDCDHISYFDTEAGLKALSLALLAP